MHSLFKPVFRFLRKTHVSFWPIGRDLSRYGWKDFWPDLFAGLNVTLIAFPQAIVYALMAGLPIEYGLFGALLASVAAGFFSGSRLLSMGPTNSSAVILLTAFTSIGILPEQFSQFLPIVLVISGVFLITSAFLNIASLVQYVSKSVILGYMYAVIIIMIVNQIHHALGFDLNFFEHSRTFFTTLIATFIGMKGISFSSMIICILSVFFFYGWKKLVPRGPVIALTVFSLALLNYILMNYFHFSTQTVHRVFFHDWHFSQLNFSLENIRLSIDVAFLLSFVTVIDGTIILKTLSSRMGKRCNINQMVFGIGLANVFCGIGNGMPASCSMVRSTANYISGAKTAVTSLFAAIFCFFGILLLGPFFHYIPKAGLATIVILLGFGLFEKHSLQIIFKTSRSDTCVFLWTFFSSFVLPLNIAISLGIFISIALFLKKAAAPSFSEYIREGKLLSQVPLSSNNLQNEVTVLHIEGNLFFGSAELFRDQIRMVCKRPQLKVIIVKLRGVLQMDATCLLALEELLRYMKAHDRQLIFTEVSKPVMMIFQRSGLYEMMGADYIFLDDELQTNLPTTQALKCAKALVGNKEMVVRLLQKPATIANERSLQQSIQSIQKPLDDRSVRVSQ